MHPESDALLDAIFDAPDDDTPRLVYADWLTEHGQPNYAEFIRLQCAAAREPLWSDAANHLWEQIGRVWTRLDEEWWPATRDGWYFPFFRGEHRRLDAVDFERGFLRDSISMTYRQLVRYGGSCWPWLPLPAMTLEDTEAESLREVLALPRVSRLRQLRVRVEGSPELPFSPLPLANLEVLDLSAVAIPSDSAEELLVSTANPRLREVRLNVYDASSGRAGQPGCIEPDVHPSARYLQDLRCRLEARFEKVVWLNST